MVDENIWQLSLYNNINASFLFLPLILIAGEMNNVVTSSEVFSGWFWVTMIAGGIFGFAIGYVTGLQIQVCSKSVVEGRTSFTTRKFLLGDIAAHTLRLWNSQGCGTNCAGDSTGVRE